MAWSNIAGPSDTWTDGRLSSTVILLMRKNTDRIVTKDGRYIRIGYVGTTGIWSNITGPTSVWSNITGP